MPTIFYDRKKKMMIKMIKNLILIILAIGFFILLAFKACNDTPYTLKKNKLIIEVDNNLQKTDFIILFTDNSTISDSLIYTNGKTNYIPNEYGENDWTIIYKDSLFVEFRHFKVNRNHRHKYRFTFTKLDDKIYCDVNIKGISEHIGIYQFNPIEECKKNDTISYSKIYDIINKNKIEATPITGLVYDTINYADGYQVKMKYDEVDNFSICSYIYNSPNDSFPKSDYFYLNNNKLPIDSLFDFNGNYRYRTLNMYDAYTIEHNSSNYLFLFTRLAYSGMFYGYDLFIFTFDKKNVEFIYRDTQLSDDPDCFGYDDSRNELLYYFWNMNNGAYSSEYSTYKLNNSSLNLLKKNSLYFETVDRYRLKILEK